MPRIRSILIGVGMWGLLMICTIILSVVMTFVMMGLYSFIPGLLSPDAGRWTLPLITGLQVVGAVYASVWLCGVILGLFAKRYDMASFRTMYVVMLVGMGISIFMGAPVFQVIMGILPILLVMTMLQVKFAPVEIDLRKGE